MYIEHTITYSKHVHFRTMDQIPVKLHSYYPTRLDALDMTKEPRKIFCRIPKPYGKKRNPCKFYSVRLSVCLSVCRSHFTLRLLALRAVYFFLQTVWGNPKL